ncbi:Gfo/Idh/MocA family protein [Streptomyces tsukubensis]|uniref:Oxidoreductase n=1 Tax=Streptomyces tsukubensis TaxID=83656 RepID=A0A1V4AAA6_9ACTN|nr:Gfo/Idh/MocA family oxidoreductase [Streptomyces tsukubensis]OON80040.1 oxidoreductase [Streptomyces tsukubensis]QFR97274.1 gfo/Idh/MocA family oxidoreductase [Streptomyces tsukubensis]
MSKQRIGLLGTGPWAHRTHARALAAHPDVELSGVWGRRAEAAAALAAEHGTRAYAGEGDGEEGVDALFAASDAVAFALPPDIQAPLAVRAAAAGCHLLMDKPVATEPAKARAVAEAVGREGVASVVFCTMRFAPGSAGWIEEQAARNDWFTAHAHWLGSLFDQGRKDSPPDSPWRREKGGLWDVGPHALSVLMPVLGDVSEVTAVRGEPDLTHLVLRHTSGVTSSATLSLSAPQAGAGAGVEFRGASGTATLPEGKDDPVVSFTAAIDALLESIRTGDPHPCDARFGLRLTEILTRAETSVRENTEKGEG